MTGILQRAAYATKGVTRSRVGSSLVNVARLAAGCYFDTFKRRYETEGMVFAIPREQTTMKMRGKFLADTYELPERTLVRRHLPPDCRVLELGGCIGVLSCVINRRLDDPTSHVVVEANPALISTLAHNGQMNGAAFRLENCVISRQASARLSVNRNMDSSCVGYEGIPVVTKTLEAVEAAHQMEFDAIVMDIEGGEGPFIEEHIEKCRHLRFLMVEFHPESLGEVTVDRLRGVLHDAGLHKTDHMLTTEVYARTH